MNHNYQVLIELYKRLGRNPDDKLVGMQLFHSSVAYAVAAVKAKFGIEYTYRAMANMMVEEQLLNKYDKPVRLSELVTNLSTAEKETGFDTSSGVII